MMKGSVILQKENVTNNAVYILILALLLAKNVFFKAALITIDLVTMPHVTMNDVKGAARSEESTESAVCCSSTDCLKCLSACCFGSVSTRSQVHFPVAAGVCAVLGKVKSAKSQ